MRIAHVILTSRFAGSERYALELAAAQAAAGEEVHLLLRRRALQARPDALGHRVGPGVVVHAVPDWLPAWHGRRRLDALAPDVAHGHLSAGCRAVAGCRRAGARVATLHIAYKPRQHARLDGLVAIAPWQMAAIPEPLRARSVQVDNWTRPAPPAPGAREALRAAHGIAPGDYLFGALGRVEDSKGLDVLVDAFARAAPPGARLAIVGQGRAWRALRRRAPADVLMPGFAARPQDWLAAFDCFVSAARSEPFGLVFLEALQAGLPVVATASQGARHLASHLGGALVPVDDVDALAAALGRALGTPRRDGDEAVAGFRIEPRLAALSAFYRARLAD